MRFLIGLQPIESLLKKSDIVEKAGCLLLFVGFLTVFGCVVDQSSEADKPEPGIVERSDLAHFFGDIPGTFVLLDDQTGEILVTDPARAETGFLPASTFKIVSTLVALESGVVDGPDFQLTWDSLAVPRQAWWPEAWAADHTLASAFRNSVVWYYQELARRIGEDRMLEFLERFSYGNEDISGGIDRFWLTGGLQISPLEQVAFLRRVYHNQIGVSDRSLDVTKSVMILEEGPGYMLRGKTGWAAFGDDEPGIGWLVGYLERDDNVYYFATNIDIRTSDDASARIPITRAILHHLDMLPE